MTTHTCLPHAGHMTTTCRSHAAPQPQVTGEVTVLPISTCVGLALHGIQTGCQMPVRTRPQRSRSATQCWPAWCVVDVHEVKASCCMLLRTRPHLREASCGCLKKAALCARPVIARPCMFVLLCPTPVLPAAACRLTDMVSSLGPHVCAHGLHEGRTMVRGPHLVTPSD